RFENKIHSWHGPREAAIKNAPLSFPQRRLSQKGKLTTNRHPRAGGDPLFEMDSRLRGDDASGINRYLRPLRQPRRRE
nr:hypothetical protein [Endozoicomonas sp.]